MLTDRLTDTQTPDQPYTIISPCEPLAGVRKHAHSPYSNTLNRNVHLSLIMCFRYNIANHMKNKVTVTRTFNPRNFNEKKTHFHCQIQMITMWILCIKLILLLVIESFLTNYYYKQYFHELLYPPVKYRLWKPWMK